MLWCVYRKLLELSAWDQRTFNVLHSGILLCFHFACEIDTSFERISYDH